jgi:flagellar basal body rod protein FlgG
MISGIYQGAASMSGLEQWQDSISQNIANTGVSGYKATGVAMESNKLDNSAPANDFSVMLGTEMVKVKAGRDASQGQIISSSSPLDCAIDGEGFFTAKNAEGGTFYTRNGQFHINRENQLCTATGDTIMGSSGAITISPGNGDVRIDQAGHVMQGSAVIGTLTISKVSNPDALIAVGGGYKLDPNSSDATVTQVEEPRVLQGFYEGSNVNPMREMVGMISVYRAYEANERVIGTLDSSLGRAISTLSA